MAAATRSDRARFRGATRRKVRSAFTNGSAIAGRVLFSHPKNFTPVCTTELGAMAGLKSEFDRRNVKILGLSVDPVEDHNRWADDIRDVTGYAPNYPLIGDPNSKIAKLYGMLPAGAGETSQGPHPGRQRHGAQRLRHRPGQDDQADPHLSDDHRPQFR